MRYCCKCQIKIEDNEERCPICGKLIEGYVKPENNGASPLYETGNLDFNGWLKNFLQLNSFKAAVILCIISFIISVVMSFTEGFGFSAIVAAVASAVGIIPFVMLLGDRNNRGNGDKALKIFKFMRVLAIIQIVLLGIMIGLFMLAAAVMAVVGTTPFGQLLPFEFYYIEEGMAYIVAASLFLGTIFAAAITLPYAISCLNLTNDIILGLKGAELPKLRGAVAYRVYSVIVFVFSVLTALNLFTFSTNLVMDLILGTETIISAIPALIFSDLLLRLNNAVKTEHYKKN